MWVINAREMTVARIDPRTRRLTGNAVQLDARPSDIAAGEGGVWVTSEKDGELLRIDPKRGRVVQRFKTKRPIRVAVGFGAVWVASFTGDVTRVDPRRSRISGGPFLPGGDRLAEDLAVGEGGVWLSDSGGTVLRFDPQTGRVTKTVEIDSMIGGLAVGAGSIWVAMGTEGDGVARIDPETGDQSSVRLLESSYPEGVAFGEGSVWATSGNRGTLTRIDPESLKVVGEPLVLGGVGPGLDVGAGGVWIPHGLDNTVSYVKRGRRVKATPRRGGKIDERAGTYRGVGLGDAPDTVTRALGRPAHWSTNEPVVPLGVDFLDTSTGPSSESLDVKFPGGPVLRYEDVFFFPCKRGTDCSGRVGGFAVTAPGAETREGVAIGDDLDEAKQKYDLKCGTANEGTEDEEFEVCAGEVAPRRYLYFGNDPIDDIEMAVVPLR